MVKTEDLMINTHVMVECNRNGLRFSQLVTFNHPFKTIDEVVLEAKRRLTHAIEKYDFIKGETLFEEIAKLYESTQENDQFIMADKVRIGIEDLHHKIERFTRERKTW